MEPATDPPLVLIVDAHAHMPADLYAALAPCDVSLVANGYSALRELNARPYDVYVCDLWLRDWSGAQFCRTIRKRDHAAPVLLYSALSNEENRSRALRAGASEYAQLPLDPRLLRGRILRLAAAAHAASIRARPALEGALEHIVRARAGEALEHARGEERAAAQMLERAAKPPAQRAFLSSGGSAACFQRWWSSAFHAAWTAAICDVIEPHKATRAT